MGASAVNIGRTARYKDFFVHTFILIRQHWCLTNLIIT